MRQIILDTETTGLSVAEGHRIIEVGCIELHNRRYTGNTFHHYFNPERRIDADAMRIHGITDEFIAGQPLFAAHAQKLLAFLTGAELIIHNAPFDMGFLNHELRLVISDFSGLEHYCTVTDTLSMARQRHPAQQNSLDALCRRYKVDNSHRDFHGALLDAKLLADVYLAMTGGQSVLFSGEEIQQQERATRRREKVAVNTAVLPIIYASAEELSAHQKRLEQLKKNSGQRVWDN